MTDAENSMPPPMRWRASSHCRMQAHMGQSSPLHSWWTSDAMKKAKNNNMQSNSIAHTTVAILIWFDVAFLYDPTIRKALRSVKIRVSHTSSCHINMRTVPNYTTEVLLCQQFYVSLMLSRVWSMARSTQYLTELSSCRSSALCQVTWKLSRRRDIPDKGAWVVKHRVKKSLKSPVTKL